jgi:drug/metabolite transporter (DMT)-like permease
MTTPKRIWIFLAVGVPALSQSANIIRLGAAHPFAITAWRLALAALLLAPLAGARLGRVRDLSGRERLLLATAGVALALHLFAWIAAVQSTTVANATLVLALNPVITAAGAYLLFGERASPRLKIAIGVGLLGVAAVGWSDLAFEPGQLVGDALSMVSAFLFSAYLLIGKRVRPKLDTDAYVTIVYGIAALVGFAAMLAIRAPMIDYTPRTWLCFGLMALVPTMLGHTSLNAAVKYVPAGRITALTLAEPLLAGSVAFVAFGERVSAGAVAGYALICGSVLITALERRPRGGNEP